MGQIRIKKITRGCNLRNHVRTNKSIAQRRQLNKHIASRGCVVWQGMKYRDEYGTKCISDSSKKKIQFTHRMSYEAHVEPIPNDLEIDHLFLNKACCNPEHLEVVT